MIIILQMFFLNALIISRWKIMRLLLFDCNNEITKHFYVLI